MFDEICWVIKDEIIEEVWKLYEFKYYILVSILFEEDGEEEVESAAGKK